MTNSEESTTITRSLFTHQGVRLFAISFLSLFIELVLIRHLGSEIRIFAYFKNLALIGAFLGLGFGYLYRAKKLDLSVTAVGMTIIALATHPYAGFDQISNYLSDDGISIWFGAGGGTASLDFGLFLLLVIFALIILTMVPMGQLLAQIFDSTPNRIAAYSINIAGSLFGIWFFSLLSFMKTAPTLWYSSAMLIILLVHKYRLRQSIIIISSFLVSFATLTHSSHLAGGTEVWSPYQQIVIKKGVQKYRRKGEIKSIDYYQLRTNNALYLYLLDLSMKLRKQHPGIFPEKLNPYFYYDMPYRFVSEPDNVLVLGAGGGNDVSAALRAGAKHVTAVEIDPVIIEFGKKLHPEKPYLSDKVKIVNNDARNYLRNSDEKFDLIILGLVDSHTLNSNYTNTSLDSYLYTKESVAQMKHLLKPDGVLALSFQLQHLWLGSKIYAMTKEVFNDAPKIMQYASNRSFITGTGGTYFLESLKKGYISNIIEGDRALKMINRRSSGYAKYFREHPSRPQSDDWPYIYIEKAAIPKLHLIVSGLLMLIFFAVYMKFFGKPGREDLHFSALGAGFLLLEVSVISRFTLFWGTTWIVSAIVISLILFAILIANTAYIKMGRHISYAILFPVLFALLLVVYFVPLESNMTVLLYLVPFVVIGYIFAQSFDNSEIGSRALAYNLFGALVGGLSESVSFVTGISALTLIAIVFYMLAALFAGAVSQQTR